MSTGGASLTANPVRHPLGLPAGSVRATMVCMILALLCLILLLPPDRSFKVPLYLVVLLGLIPLFVVSHGRSIKVQPLDASPWWLPGGTFRFLVTMSLAATTGWGLYDHPDQFLERLRPPESQLYWLPYLLAAATAGFFLGRLVRLLPFRNNPVVADLLAWLAGLAMTGLVVDGVIRMFINPQVSNEIQVEYLEVVLTGIVIFYFGARS